METQGIDIVRTGLAKLKLNSTLESMGIKNIQVLTAQDKSLEGDFLAEDDPESMDNAQTFDEPNMPYQNHDVQLMYDLTERSYWLCPDRTPLDEAVDSLKIVFPEGHPKAGQYITSADVDTSMYPGTFFPLLMTSKDDRVKRSLKGGELLLDLSDDYDRMLVYGLMYDSNVNVVDQDINKHTRSNPKFSLYMPQVEGKQAIKKGNDAIDAITKLHPKLGLKEARLKLVAKIMNVTGYEQDTNDLDQIRVAIMNEVIDRNSALTRFGKKKGVSVFLSLAKTKIDALKKYEIVNQALGYNRIVKVSGEYSWAHSEEVIADVSNDLELFEMFASPLNEAKFNKIKEEVTMVTEQLYGQL